MDKKEKKKHRNHHEHEHDAPAESPEDRGTVARQEAAGGQPGEIEAFRKKLEQMEKDAQEAHDRLLRMAADFENYRKRAAREKEEWAKFANEDLLKEILPFIDNLERAINHSEKAEGTPGLVEGVKLTIQGLLQKLSRFGVTPIESVGKPFDPAVHEAMLVVETSEHEPNQVMQELQRGYLLNNRLLRPATVSVSKQPDRERQDVP